VKRRTARRHDHERIGGDRISPLCRQRHQRTAAVIEVHAVGLPVLAALDELELLPDQADETDASPAPAVHHTDPRYHAQSTVRSNGRLEGLNSRIRPISHRSFGFHSAEPLIALVYLCCTRILIPLPR